MNKIKISINTTTSSEQYQNPIEKPRKQRVPLMGQKLLTLPEHLSSYPIFTGVRVPRSLVLYVCFVDCCLSFCSFSFDHCVVCSSAIYVLVSSNSSSCYWKLHWFFLLPCCPNISEHYKYGKLFCCNNVVMNLTLG